MSTLKANKDSSSREKHGRYDLITPYGLRRVALRYHFGAKKYGDKNWEKGVPLSNCLDSLLRHVNQYKMGDKEEDHMAAAAWWAFAIMHFEDTGYFNKNDEDGEKWIIPIRCPYCDWKPRGFTMAEYVKTSKPNCPNCGRIIAEQINK